ncbi:ASCH domain-containing protein [Acinetobacter baumannii]|nr:ASCH domain-containing protein [Acinetobacter baumannii]
MQQFLALSVVAPNGTRIAQRIKTLEVRSWVPAQLPLKDLFIVENQNFWGCSRLAEVLLYENEDKSL